MKQEEKNKQVEETLQALDGISRAQAPAYLFEKTMLRMQGKVVQMQPAQIWATAACIAVLIFANVFACADFEKMHATRNNPEQQFASEYFAFSQTPEF